MATGCWNVRQHFLNWTGNGTEQSPLAGQSHEHPPYDKLESATLQNGVAKHWSAHLEENRHAGASLWRSESVALWHMIRTKWISLLLVTLPLAPLSVLLDWTDTKKFIFNFVPMLPLAAILGDFTQVIARELGNTTGGFVSASLGNTAELVFAVQALRANELRVVQISLLGSILSNLLFVLGTAFLTGGLFSGKKEQSFSSVSAVANTSLLLLSCLSLGAPTPIASYADAEDDAVLTISRIISVFMLIIYAQLMVFQFKTHKYLFQQHTDDEDQEGVGHDAPRLHLWTAGIGLAVVTALIAIFCDNLVGSINGFSEESHIPRAFTSFIIIPIIGNVVEYFVATSFAVKDKMELAMGIAVGSACQASIFVFPSCVLIAWAMDRDLTLMFPKYDLFIYFMSVIIVAHLVAKGTSNWLEGSTLVTSYLVIGLGYWFIPPQAVLDGMD